MNNMHKFGHNRVLKSPTTKIIPYSGQTHYSSAKMLQPSTIVLNQQCHGQYRIARKTLKKTLKEPNDKTNRLEDKFLKRNLSMKLMQNMNSCRIISDNQHTEGNSPKLMPFKRRIQLIKKSNPLIIKSQKTIKSEQLLPEGFLKRQSSKLKIKVRNPFQKRMKLDDQLQQSRIQCTGNSQISQRNVGEIQEILQLML